MNMTSIFAELVIIGTHSLIWLGFLSIGIFNYKQMQMENILDIKFIAPTIAIAYIIGILIDRFSDILLRRLDRKFRLEYIENNIGMENFLEIRFYILKNSIEMYQQLEYTRSRLRVARSSIINFILCTLISAYYVCVKIITVGINNIETYRYMYASIIGLALACLSYFTWKSLIKSYTLNTLAAYKVIKNA